MRTLITTILLFFSVIVKGQQTDILYVEDQKSLVISYNYKQLGLYFGGYYTTSFPQPYTYTTPYTILNRIGLSYVNKKNTIFVMGGAFIKNYQFEPELVPDLWFGIHPIRMLTRNKKGLDFSFAINYSERFRYGVGLSIPLSGIYY
jgi:hypothetical protein